MNQTKAKACHNVTLIRVRELLTFKSSGTSELAFSLMVKEALVCMTAAAHYILGLAVSM